MNQTECYKITVRNIVYILLLLLLLPYYCCYYYYSYAQRVHTFMGFFQHVNVKQFSIHNVDTDYCNVLFAAESI